MRVFQAAPFSEYTGRPLRRIRHGSKTYACDRCKATSLSGIYGPVDNRDLWLCGDCFQPIKDARYAVKVPNHGNRGKRGKSPQLSKA